MLSLYWRIPARQHSVFVIAVCRFHVHFRQHIEPKFVLKGPCPEIFDFRFGYESFFSQAPECTIMDISNFSKVENLQSESFNWSPWLGNISVNFRKNSKWPYCYFQRLGGRWLMKKTWTKKSHYTVPLNMPHSPPPPPNKGPVPWVSFLF